MNCLRSTSAVSLILAMSLATGSALAQTEETESASTEKTRQLETVIVTASKSGAQELQSVPLAIQAFSAEDLKVKNINTIDDLVSSIPGAYEGQRQSVASRSYNLRGAGGSNANGDSPIGYYLDDVPFIVTNFGIAPPVRFLDMERVEVLRGPHGTLYGQGSSGGVFIFHTKDPNLTDMEWAAELESSKTTGSDGSNFGYAGAVSIPIIEDRLAVRISGGTSENAGWADVYYGLFDGTPDRKDANVMKNDDIRVVALAKPADNITLRAQYWHFQPRQDFLGNMASVEPPYYQNTQGQPSFGNGDFKLFSFTADVEFDNFTLTSATSDLSGNFGIYIPQSPSGFFSSQFYPEMFAQEIRGYSTGDGPFNWVLGAQYLDGQGPQKNQLLNPTTNINADNNTITESYAVFGEVSYDLMDGKLVPLVGLRQYHDERTFEDATSSLPNEKDVTTWRVNVSYLPSDNLTMFATAATGFRAGIVQSQAQVQSLQLAGVPVSVALNPETSKNYEVGLKWRGFDNALSVGLNLYQTEYTDMQTNTPGAIVGVNGFSNFGDATSKGLDYELRWMTPVEGLSVGIVGNVNDTNYDTVNPAVQAALPLFRPGSRVVNTIESNYRLDASYSRQLTDEFEGFGNIGYSRSGDRLQANGRIADPYSMANFTLGVRTDNYEVSLFGTNLTDERGPTFVGNAGAPAGAGPTPKTIGVRLRVMSQ
ncbi:TonB-dependent receptor [Hyphomonas sp.]|uniref:TonB-dependent receptor n=1 Tax=Hyphomonas sp. TaxID=87 RepID=UPI00391ADD1C